MRGNLPDDYNMYWRNCSRCGRKFHASDGGCDYCIEKQMALLDAAIEKFTKKFFLVDVSGERYESAESRPDLKDYAVKLVNDPAVKVDESTTLYRDEEVYQMCIDPDF